MNVFAIRDRLIADYHEYIRSFVTIRDQAINEYVHRSLESGVFWPDPLIQLNPSFEPGEWIDTLVGEGTLQAECAKIFRVKRNPHDQGEPLRTHRHQTEAIRVARQGHNYVLTTGTGSGKSLAYIIPIVDYVLRSAPSKSVKAIVVYPMNALANSQAGELEKFLKFGYPDGAGRVTYARYTGQESDQERQAVMANPPDILLTNYVMLELILTRPVERPLIEAAQGLQFLVLDELHTYRGRQGADVAMLVRRVRDRLSSPGLQTVGTSATLAGVGTYDQQRAEVATVATRLFGAKVNAEHVIGETLRRATPDRTAADTVFVQELAQRVADPERQSPRDYHTFAADPLSSWIETTFGLATEPGTGRLIRSTPRSITGSGGAAQELSDLTGVDVDQCAQAIQRGLLGGYECEPNPETGYPAFAFRLHQILSRGDSVYASLESESARYVTLNAQQYLPGSRDHVLLPLAFCRECGQEYYSVRRVTDPLTDAISFAGRQVGDQYDTGEGEAGYLYTSTGDPWPSGDDDAIRRRVPSEWLEDGPDGPRLQRDRRKDLPQPYTLTPGGTATAGEHSPNTHSHSTDGDHNGSTEDEGITDSEGRLLAHYFPAPFRFCIHCGVSYDYQQSSDFGKLASLSSEGRSTATTILSMSSLRSLRDSDLPKRARKLLSFADNRQDASLQAGHFNDFIDVSAMRAALYQAVNAAGPSGASHDVLTQRVFDALALPLTAYAVDPDVKFAALKDTQRALRDVLGYRLYRDLKRGWRVTSPNLEQAGLLEIQYMSLDELCDAEEEWQACHPALVSASPDTRLRAAKTLLDYMRRELAIKVDYLEPRYQESIAQQSSMRLRDPWAIDENEVTKMEHSSTLYPRSRRQNDYRGNVYLSPRGGFGLYLRRRATFPEFDGNASTPAKGSAATKRLTQEDVQAIVVQLLEALRVAGIVEIVKPAEKEGDVAGYQLNAAAMTWVAGSGSRAYHDPIRVPNEPAQGSRTNPFFVQFYATLPNTLEGMRAREHTAQVPYALREQREDEFRAGDLPILYCSPTMELGVDISELNVVNMRNVPPTPANYAQRSGRAGRSGQPALVFTYCTTGSPHDQYFFKHPHMMVSGAVAPPRLDLSNEDLVRSHVHAIWLAETGQSLGKSLRDILNVTGEQPTLALADEVRDSVENESARQRAMQRAERVLATLGPELQDAAWYSAGWLDEVLTQVARQFDETASRWRSLYRAALKQRDIQHAVAGDVSRTQQDREIAKRLRREAEAQIELLTQVENVVQSDFYSYRYYASEGFLPGYSFPRLPISAFIPARRVKQDEFVSRSRFLAISEFGPRSIIYHEGSRYMINRVILPVAEDDGSGSDQQSGVPMVEVKLCEECGYLHSSTAGNGPDLCERCGSPLNKRLHPLFKMQNVSTKRRDRINSDEEERQRMGYEIQTAVRWAEHDGQPSYRTGVVQRAGAPPTGDDSGGNGGNDTSIASMSYGQAATIWRINLGEARRRNRTPGFMLDLERGYWARNEQTEPDELADPMSPRVARVIPYVEDRRNCLMLQPTAELATEPGVMASLASALKSAMQVTYQLEDNELAVEPLPGRGDPRLLLFYESAEGGAGVLKRLLEEPGALPAVAREALRICHFDPDTGDDLRRAPRAKEDCEAACYDCLMNYHNQRDHRVLDRQAIKGILRELAAAKVELAPANRPRAEHLDTLMRTAGSELERRWLHFLHERGLRLPDSGQRFLDSVKSRPDFLYEGDYGAAIYIDGPVHDYPLRHERDVAQTEMMEDKGFIVIRFHHQDDWAARVAQYPYIFGKMSDSAEPASTTTETDKEKGLTV